MSDSDESDNRTVQDSDPCPICGYVAESNADAYHHAHTEHPDKVKVPLEDYSP